MTLPFNLASTTFAAAAAATTSAGPVAEEEEYYSSWSLFLVCMLLILSLLTSYYLQIKRIRALHETLVSIVAGMFVGLIIRLAPGTMIREMLVSFISHGRNALGFVLVQGDAVVHDAIECKTDYAARLLNILFSSISCFRPSS